MTAIVQHIRRALAYWRVTFVIIGMLSLYTVVVGKLYYLEVSKGSYYAARAESQDRAQQENIMHRGQIYFVDKNNNKIPAAVKKSYESIFAVPKEIDDVLEVSNELGAMLGLDIPKLKQVLAKPNDQYELLVRKAGVDQIEKLQNHPIKGIYVDEQEQRYYPFGELAAQVLGYVGMDDNSKESGKYGVEAYFEKKLTGSGGDGANDITLTIDRNIQAEAEEILNNLVQSHNATGGTVIVQEPKTGKIIALANNPTFDPNDYAAFPIKHFLNPAVQAVYEPGSIFKVITMAGAIDAGKITPETTYVDAGELTLDGKTIKNWDLKAHGKITMTEVIEGSVNTGAVFAENKLGHDQFYKYLLDFGFGEKNGVDLPGEVQGSLRTLQQNVREINFATAAYGQGVSVTPLGLAAAISTIANGGLLLRPYVSEESMPAIVHRVITKESATSVTKMMVSAVDKAGVAAIPNYNIAGKTGTAFIPDFIHGGYTHEVINTYVGYAPAFDPQFLILIKLDKPEGAPLAGLTVVPTFRELAEFMINYLHIPPDRQTDVRQPAQ